MTPATHTPGFRKWPQLHNAYFDPSDLSAIAQAQSILRGELGYTPRLTASEAKDVLAHRARGN